MRPQGLSEALSGPLAAFMGKHGKSYTDYPGCHRGPLRGSGRMVQC